MDLNVRLYGGPWDGTTKTVECEDYGIPAEKEFVFLDLEDQPRRALYKLADVHQAATCRVCNENSCTMDFVRELPARTEADA